MNVNTETIFPTPIGYADLGVDPDWRRLVEIRGFREGDFYQTEMNLHEDPLWKPLANKCLEASNAWVKQLGYDVELFMTRFWINKYSPGQTIEHHRHPNSFVSGVYYFEDCSGTVFHKTEIGKEMRVKIGNLNEYTATSAGNAAKAGTLCMFLSHTEHSSDPDMNIRYSVSFNTMPKVLGGDPNFAEYVVLRD